MVKVGALRKRYISFSLLKKIEKGEFEKELYKQALRFFGEYGFSKAAFKLLEFKGKEGIKTVMRDVLREGKDYVFVGEAEKYFSYLEVFSIQWLKKIEKRKIRGRLLCPEKQKFKVAKTETYRLLPQDLIPEISTKTYGNKTALFVWSKPFYVILINSKSVADSNRKTFEYLWKIAKKPPKRHIVESLVK